MHFTRRRVHHSGSAGKHIQDLLLNTSTCSSTDTTEEYDLCAIANKLDEVFKDSNKIKILQLYADMIDIIIISKRA